MTQTELVRNFERYFFIRRAVSEEMRALAFQVRYQVYCEELKFEDRDSFPDRAESDSCDSYADHFLIFHRGDPDQLAGTVRLVLPQNDSQKLPIELHCRDAVSDAKIDFKALSTGKMGELSRLAVTDGFRRRQGEVRKPYIVNDSPERFGFPSFPYIAVGLYMAAAASCYQQKMKSVLVMMEPRLARHLARFGILFEQVGEMIDFHGRRAPFMITEEVFFRHIKPPILALYEHVAAEISNPDNHL